MKVLLLKLFVLGEAVLLAAPPAACCVDFRPNLPKTAALGGSCCRHEAPQPVESPQRKHPQPSQCCCRYDAVPRSEQTSPGDLHSLPAAANWIEVQPPQSEPLIARPIAEVIDPGPPLHVIQCVWLC